MQTFVPGISIADPAAMNKRPVIRKGRMSPQRTWPGTSIARSALDSGVMASNSAVNAALDDTAFNVNTAYVQEKERGGLAMSATSPPVGVFYASTPATSTRPTITVSNTALSKSYNAGTARIPSRVTLGASSVSGPPPKLGGERTQ